MNRKSLITTNSCSRKTQTKKMKAGTQFPFFCVQPYLSAKKAKCKAVIK